MSPVHSVIDPPVASLKLIQRNNVLTPDNLNKMQPNDFIGDHLDPSTAEHCTLVFNSAYRRLVEVGLKDSRYDFYNTFQDEDNDEDCNLTNLDWLTDQNLLRNLFKNSGTTNLLHNNDYPSSLPLKQELIWSDHQPYPTAYHPSKHQDCKPPYSFSCLIFMAIDHSPDKRLPVKDIYNWIQNNFKFFSRAPGGWKNSVRHNLSLNKCFMKVEKDRSAVSAYVVSD